MAAGIGLRRPRVVEAFLGDEDDGRAGGWPIGKATHAVEPDSMILDPEEETELLLDVLSAVGLRLRSP
jgi:hypothetical protein